MREPTLYERALAENKALRESHKELLEAAKSVVMASSGLPFNAADRMKATKHLAELIAELEAR